MLILSSLILCSVKTVAVGSLKDVCWISLKRSLVRSMEYVALRPIRTNLKENVCQNMCVKKFTLFL